MLGDIASVATLILFVIYFIGRIISLIIEKNVICEKIDIFINEKDLTRDLKIAGEYKCEYNEEILIITPYEKSYNWLSIFECKYDKRNNCIRECRELQRFKKILNNTSIRVDTVIADATPLYMIEFERSDFIRGTLLLQNNGKNGIQEEMLKIHHTWKSVIYYLFK